MSAFREVRFPTEIAKGARGGPRRRTRVVTLASGHEERNAAWANSRRYYDVSYGLRFGADLDRVVAFFEAMNGRLTGFRFKDWSDYRSGAPLASVSATDQLLGQGNGSAVAFQLRKGYTAGADTWWRDVAKPVAGTVVVALDGVVQAGGWSVDATTGVVTFDAAPGVGVDVTAGFEFDVPVRFDSDELPLVMDLEHLGRISSILLAEIRV